MERKKIFRSVWFWVVLVVLLALTFSSFFRGGGEYQVVSTSTALAQFADGNVANATIKNSFPLHPYDTTCGLQLCAARRPS